MKYHLLIILFLACSLSLSGENQIVVTARFSNPVLDCELQTYCVDVEFHSDTDNIRLFAMNVRLFFDDEFLSFIEFNDFAEGYAPVSPDPPNINQLTPGAGNTLFGFNGEAVYINGAMQLVNSSAPPVYISTDSWTKLFSICFNIDMTSISSLENICPGIIWDLQEDPEMGGFFSGSEGVVITIVNPEAGQPSLSVTENVVQFNWVYTQNSGYPYGQLQETDCIINPCNDGSIVILPGQHTCFESEEPLIIGGNPPTFTVEENASAFLVSSVSIILKPGTVVKEEAYLRAWISDEGCVQPSSILVTEAERIDDSESNSFPLSNDLFRVYPNPTKGSFNLELNKADEYTSAMVEVYTMSGEIILQQSIGASQVHHFEIAHSNPGLYLVRVIRNDWTGLQKLIKH